MQDHIDAATEIARKSGEIALSYFAADRMETRAKGYRDVVTLADTESERYITSALAEAFPGDGVVGEEGAAVPSENGRRWYVDPVDGTLNYSRGIPIWCVSLSLFDEQGPLLGVVHDPIRGETFAAGRGAGARCGGTPLRTSGLRALQDAVVHVTVDFREESLLEGLDDLSRLAPRVLRTRNIGSAALALAYVAAGRFDAMIHRYAHTWDYGAGVLLVREAGGSVSDLAGNEYSVDTFAVGCASTEELRRGLVEAIELPGPG